MKLAACNYKLNQENIFVLCSEYKMGTKISKLQEEFRISRTSVVYHLTNAGLYKMKHKAKVR
jgi:predicted DNA-binding transcriptional regulator